MKEDFLHFIWKFKLFDASNLTTVNGEKISVLQFGSHNTDAGPDFFNAKVKIDSTVWAGNVEIHLKSSDWDAHNHSQDNGYDNVILHVVYENDKEIFNSKNELIPCLELKKYINENYYTNYKSIIESNQWIPCANQIKEVDKFVIDSFLERLLIERLERKSERFKLLLENTKNNWNEAFYIAIATAFGYKINATAFEILAKSVSNLTLAKHKDKLIEIESILFGQAGFLEDEYDNHYFHKLKKEYSFWEKKYGLEKTNKSLFKFLRLRPGNFPTIRIAQLSALIFKSNNLFSRILEAETVGEIMAFFDVSVSNFWETHYTFEKNSVRKDKKLGQSTIEIVIINTVVPFLFLYGKQKANELYCDRALLFLEQLGAEGNNIIQGWKQLHIKAENAANSQSLIELKTNYCDAKKCLNCSIGHAVLKSSMSL